MFILWKTEKEHFGFSINNNIVNLLIYLRCQLYVDSVGTRQGLMMARFRLLRLVTVVVICVRYTLGSLNYLFLLPVVQWKTVSTRLQTKNFYFQQESK